MKLFEVIWENKVVRELVLLVATACAVVLVAQLQALDRIFEDGASLDELKVWLEAAGSALGITAIRQAIAFVTARLAGSRL